MLPHMVSLIINADDYGISPAVTSGIAELLANNCVSNSTAMMCVPGSIDIQRQLSGDVNTRQLGVHLQLTSGRPLLYAPNIRHIDSTSGFFRGKDDFQMAQPDQVYEEWRAQIELFIALYGHRPSHVDSHHGPHQDPKLLPVYVSLAKEYGVAARASGAATLQLLSEANVLHTDAVLGDWTAEGRSVSDLFAITRALAADTSAESIEVITHPGFVDDDLRGKSSLTDLRRSEFLELRKLTSSSLNEAGFLLVSYPLSTR